MTCREKFELEHPDGNINKCCPDTYVYAPMPKYCASGANGECDACWDREIPEEKDKALSEIEEAQKRLDELEKYTKSNTPHILDSGERREFESGAVRDIQEGKGRCDLMPLDVIRDVYMIFREDDPTTSAILSFIYTFTCDGNYMHLYHALDSFDVFSGWETMFLEVSKHFEEGAKKYGEHNWQKGIPTHCYIDSAVRHYLKFVRGDEDEPHDRAFVWNILCCIWTCIHKPEFNDYLKTEASNETSN